MRSIILAVVGAACALTPLRGEVIEPVAVMHRSASSIPVRIGPEPPSVGPVPS